MNALKLLAEQSLETKRLRYPTIKPEYIPLTKYSDKTANALTKAIVEFIQLNGGQAERISNMGRVVDGRKRVTDTIGRTKMIGSMTWIKGSGKNGTADISATIKGKSVKIEVKIGKDRQSDEQMDYQNEVERAGGVYFIAKDFQSFYDFYNSEL